VNYGPSPAAPGTVSFEGQQGDVTGEVRVRVGGATRTVTALEIHRPDGTVDTVTEWHRGPKGEFLLTLNSLTFVQPATFGVAIASTTDPVKPGNTLDVTVDVTNTGDETGTQTVTLDIDNGVGQVDSQSVAVGGGGSATTTLSWDTTGQTEQDYTATVSSADDSASQTVTVSSVPPSLVSRWTFDDADTNSGTAVDVVGSNDGTIQGATTGVSGANQTYTTNEAYSFDGTDDRVEIPNLGFGKTSTFTVAAWIKIDSLSTNENYAWFGRFNPAGDDALYSYWNRNESQFSVEIGEFDSTDTTGLTGGSSTTNWQHVAFTWDGGTDTLTFYQDGVAQGSVTKNVTEFAASGDIWIGGRSDGAQYFEGDIDDVRVYDKALTSTEVSNLYNNARI